MFGIHVSFRECSRFLKQPKKYHPLDGGSAGCHHGSFIKAIRLRPPYAAPCLRWVARERIHIPPNGKRKPIFKNALVGDMLVSCMSFMYLNLEVITYVSSMDTAYVRKSPPPKTASIRYSTIPEIDQKSFDIRKELPPRSLT